MRWSVRVLLMTAALGLPAGLAFAQSQSSANYQNTDPVIVPASINSQSANYIINGSVDVVVGSAQSASYVVQSGSQAKTGTTAAGTSPSGGIPGGGGIGTTPLPTLPPPTIQPKKPWTYLSTIIFYGNRGTDNARMLINGSSIGVRYPTISTWERDIPLGLGQNVANAQANLNGSVSPVVSSEARRRLIGDVNDSRFVDDVDLSLFTRHWGVFDQQSDFNEDAVLDDLDLSLLASHWNQSF